MNKSIINYEIYTDGAAKGNDAAHRSGGWAYCILFDGDIIRKDSGTVLDTTNQRMELQAVIEGLKACEFFWNEDYEYHFYCDSAYVINCYHQGWYINWEQNGYKNAKKQPIANMDLWSQIIPYFKRKSFFFHKVEGHANNYYNNFVDRMAQAAAASMSKR